MLKYPSDNCAEIRSLFDSWQDISISDSNNASYLKCIREIGLPIYDSEDFPFFNFYTQSRWVDNFLCFGDDHRGQLVIDGSGIFVINIDGGDLYKVSSSFYHFIYMIKECISIIKNFDLSSEAVNDSIMNIVGNIDPGVASDKNWWSITIPHQYWGENPDEL